MSACRRKVWIVGHRQVLCKELLSCLPKTHNHVCVSFSRKFWAPIYTFRHTFAQQPGSHGRKANNTGVSILFSTFHLRYAYMWLCLREGLYRPFPSSTFKYSRKQYRFPPLGIVQENKQFAGIELTSDLITGVCVEN